jgi:biotin-[acetyl-CoA-carboxylase] ligase BirA-like protein
LVLVANAPGSQFDLLRDQIAGPVRDVGPTACVALEGRNFHGHRGRPWQAARGNLHLSAAWPTRLPAATWAACLSMLPAVAVVDALTAVTNGAVRPGTKWVNDVLVPAGKLAGVLTATQVLGGDIDLVVFGIGLNVATAPQIEPTPFVPSAACLRECEGADRVTLGAVLRALIDALASRLVRLEHEGPLPVWRDYVRSSLVVGRRVRVWDERAIEGLEMPAWPAAIAAGVVTGIGPDLTLSIEGSAGPVARGRLAFEEACAAFEA